MKLIATLNALLLIAGLASAADDKAIEQKNEGGLRKLEKSPKEDDYKGGGYGSTGPYYEGLKSKPCPEGFGIADIEFGLYDSSIVTADSEVRGRLKIEGYSVSAAANGGKNAATKDIIDDTFKFVIGNHGPVLASSQAYSRNLCLSKHYCYTVTMSLTSDDAETADYFSYVSFDGRFITGTAPTTSVPNTGQTTPSFGDCY